MMEFSLNFQSTESRHHKLNREDTGATHWGKTAAISAVVGSETPETRWEADYFKNKTGNSKK